MLNSFHFMAYIVFSLIVIRRLLKLIKQNQCKQKKQRNKCLSPPLILKVRKCNCPLLWCMSPPQKQPKHDRFVYNSIYIITTGHVQIRVNVTFNKKKKL